MNLLLLSLVLIVVVIFAILRKPKTSSTLVVDRHSFKNYMKFMEASGETITKGIVKTIEGFTIAMGGKFLVRSQVNADMEQYPKAVLYLKNKAKRAWLFWEKLSGSAKKASVVTGIIVFILLYNIWLGPLWEMTKASGEFLYSILQSSPEVIAVVALFLIVAYIAKKLAKAREAKYNKTAKSIEAEIPELREMQSILNQK